jgi:hypothetical protein
VGYRVSRDAPVSWTAHGCALRSLAMKVSREVLFGLIMGPGYASSQVVGRRGEAEG